MTSLVWADTRRLTNCLFGTGGQQCGKSVCLVRGPGKEGQKLPKEGTLVDKAIIIIIKH